MRTANVHAIEGLVRNSAVDGVESVLYGLGNGLLKSNGRREGGAGRRSGGGAGDLGGDPASSNCEGGHCDDVWLVGCFVYVLGILGVVVVVVVVQIRSSALGFGSWFFLVICLGEKKVVCLIIGVCVTEWKGKKE